MEIKEGTELIKRWDIPDTPFQIIGVEDTQFFGVMGDARITEVYDNKLECENELTKAPDWNRLIQVMLLLIEKREFLDNIKNQEQ
jgi:hypothetical protein